MYRYIVGFILVLCVWVYIQRTFQDVMKQVTAKHPANEVRVAGQSRRRCVMCGGTGRVATFMLGGSSSSQSDVCRTCNGFGWVDNPVFGNANGGSGRK